MSPAPLNVCYKSLGDIRCWFAFLIRAYLLTDKNVHDTMDCEQRQTQQKGTLSYSINTNNSAV